VVRVPEAIVNVENVTPVTMEEVVSRLTAALVKVVSNKGAPGPNGQTVEQLREQWPIAGPKLAAGLLDGTYRPGAIRRANIPKAGGRMRGLGIPNVTDRVVCEAARQVLEPVFEPTFHLQATGSDRAAVATRRSKRQAASRRWAWVGGRHRSGEVL
jgi:retron-type reverse transcriptase